MFLTSELILRKCLRILLAYTPRAPLGSLKNVANLVQPLAYFILYILVWEPSGAKLTISYLRRLPPLFHRHFYQLLPPLFQIKIDPLNLESFKQSKNISVDKNSKNMTF